MLVVLAIDFEMGHIDLEDELLVELVLLEAQEMVDLRGDDVELRNAAFDSASQLVALPVFVKD